MAVETVGADGVGVCGVVENSYGGLKRDADDLRGTLAGLRQPPQASSEARTEYPG